MQSKSLLIAIAAFAVTATGVHAYSGSTILNRAGLSNKQVSAIQEAQVLQKAGDTQAARDVLLAAGITADDLLSIHHTAQAAQAQMREALLAGDYELFQVAIEGTPLADIITTEADFAQFKEAHELRRIGEWEEAQDVLFELGVDIDRKHQYHPAVRASVFEQLSTEQRDAFMVAKQANDRATMQAILDEAGIE